MWTDPRFEAVPEQRRVALFREFKALLNEVEAYQRSQASKKADAERAAAEEAAKLAAAGAKVRKPLRCFPNLVGLGLPQWQFKPSNPQGCVRDAFWDY